MENPDPEFGTQRHPGTRSVSSGPAQAITNSVSSMNALEVSTQSGKQARTDHEINVYCHGYFAPTRTKAPDPCPTGGGQRCSARPVPDRETTTAEDAPHRRRSRTRTIQPQDNPFSSGPETPSQRTEQDQALRTSRRALTRLKGILAGRWGAPLVADDPDPQPSRLDRLDGLSDPDDLDDYDQIDHYLKKSKR